MGHLTYPQADSLLVTAAQWRKNSARSRLWKVCLQEICDKTGLTISVCHFPPGTSKWNTIEHRMFCHINQNCAAVPWRVVPWS